jgi:hypothetical protein
MPVLVPPSRFERALRCCAYLFVGAVGVWGLFLVLRPELPAPFGALGAVLEAAWCVLMATALIAAPAAAGARYRIEFAVLPLFGSALALGAGYGWYQTIAAGPSFAARAAIATALCLELAARYWTLHRLTRKGAQPWTPSS